MGSFERNIVDIIATVRTDLGKIRNLTALADLYFDQGLYRAVVDSLLNGNFSGLPQPAVKPGDFREYLYAYSFRDESNQLYLATFYDSDTLEQDPQVIDILKWEHPSWVAAANRGLPKDTF